MATTKWKLIWLSAWVASVLRLEAQSPADVLPLTLGEAEELLLAGSPDIKWMEANVEVAAGELRQSKVLENPEVTVLHNVNNPVTRRYFEWGREGETDIQVSQRLFIGGQRRNAVRRNASLHGSGVEALAHTRLAQLAELHKAMIDLVGLHRKAALYASQVEVLGRILTASSAQQGKGNIAPLETARIRAMLFMAQREVQENAANQAAKQMELKKMLGVSQDIRPVLPPADREHIAALLQASPHLADRADIRSLSMQVEASRHETAWQRSLALPEVSVLAEWDKNGNIGRDFFAIGASVTVPLFNHNKGSIASAKVRQQQAEDAYRLSLREAGLEVERLQGQVRALLALADVGDIEAEQTTVMEQAARQYLKRNISLMEFSGHLEACRDALLAAIDNQTNLQKAIVELKKAKGQ